MARKVVWIIVAPAIALLANLTFVKADSLVLEYEENGHLYQRFDSAMDWDGARGACEDLGGHLVTISSPGENAFVFNNFVFSQAWPWLGATDEGDEGNWTWVSGEPFAYTNWCINEPNNCGGTGCPPEHHLGFFNQEMNCWNDLPNLELAYICEWLAQPVNECVGFESPLASGPVTLRGKNRALPFKAQLLDAEGFGVTDLDIIAPPIIQVWWEFGTPEAGDEPEDVLPAGKSTEGNQFFFDSDQRWHFNLKTKDYSASGTYTVFMESGDPSEYMIDPMCVAEFVVQ